MNGQYMNHYVGLGYGFAGSGIVGKVLRMVFSGIKFIFDRILAMFGLIIAFPLMVIIGIFIKLDSKGPILFRQERTGRNGKSFYIYKFRTMVANNDVHDFSKGDKHTKIGKVLRKTSLDELPQLISIAIGKMSFIGPRPWITDYYENMNDEQRHRCDVRPGLTGLAQVKGRNDVSIFEKINCDLEYINNYSLLQDLKIIYWTIKVVFEGSGADAGKDTIHTEIEQLKNQKSVCI